MSAIATVAADISSDVYSSFAPKSAADAARLYNALSSAKSLKDAVNVPITVTDVIVRPGTVTDSETGAQEDRLVVTLIAEDGTVYASNSPTVVADIRNLMQIMGEPGSGYWGKGLTVVPKMGNSSNGRSFITISLPVPAGK